MTPPVNPVEAMRRQLAVAVFGAVKETDVLALVHKLHAMAMEGDHRALKMYLELVGVMGKEKPAPPASTATTEKDSPAIRQLAESLGNLVDEIRIGRASTARIERERASLVNGSDHED